MFVHIDIKKVFDVVVGHRLVDIVCERCQCEYYYLLARRAVGATTVVYGYGKEAARPKAMERSRKNLESRLTNESELVPCPKCGWINDDIIKRYRTGSYAWWGVSAFLFGFFLTVVPLILAAGQYAENGRDKWLVPYLVIIGPGAGISIALVLMTIRWALRSRYRPNRNYPLPSPIPPGTPPALVLNPQSAELEIAASSSRPAKEADGWRDFQIGRAVFPAQCCVCLSEPDEGQEYKTTTGVVLKFPRCIACAKAARRKGWISFLAAFVGGILFGGAALAGTLAAFQLEVIYFIIFIIPIIVCFLFIAAIARMRVMAPLRIVVWDGTRGVMKARFRNPQFQPIDLCNLPEIRNLGSRVLTSADYVSNPLDASVKQLG